MARIPYCHPEEKHEAHGMCIKCYRAWKWKADKDSGRINDNYITKAKAAKLKYAKSEKGKKRQQEYYLSEGKEVRKRYGVLRRERGDYKTEVYKHESKLRKVRYRAQGNGKQVDKKYKQSDKYRQYLKSEGYKEISRKGNSLRKQQQRIANLKGAYKNDTYDVYIQCPKGMHVDHIIPLTRDDICGLHVPWNMQYLNPADNNKKFNKWDWTYDNEGWRANDYF